MHGFRTIKLNSCNILISSVYTMSIIILRSVSLII